MWHRIAFVAESRRVDASNLEAFALAHQGQYGVIAERDAVEVSTWHGDALVRDFDTQRSVTTD